MKTRIVVVLVLFCVAAGSVHAQGGALSSVGALGAGFMYTSYLAIGAIADGHYHEVYDDETSMQLLEEIKNLTDATSESLQQLLGSEELMIDDFNFVNEMVATLGLLSREAQSYRSFIQTGEERYATVYDNFRNNAWSKITNLLGIEE